MGNCSNQCGRSNQLRKKPVTINAPEPLAPTGHHLIENLKLGKTQRQSALGESYDVDRENPLGRGIGGWVYMATHKESGQKYAVKHLKTEGIQLSFKKKEDLRSELMLMCELDHPHIVKLREVIEAPDGFHLIQDLSTGGELLKRINFTGFTEDGARQNILTMIDVLRYLQDKQIVHCDLKPENWLFENDDDGARLQLIDFGFSRYLKGAQNLTHKRGSTLYIAPEVFKGNYDGRADMWSLGVIAYMMLFRVAPFIKLDATGIVDLKMTSAMIQAGDFAFPGDSGVSKDAEDFISKLLTVDPSKRMTAAEAQQHIWLKVASARPSALPSRLATRMKSFSELNSLQRTVSQVLAYMLDKEQIKRLRTEFAKLDEERNGEVSYKEFQNAFERSNIELGEDDMQDIFKSIDFDNTGNIHWHEFLAATIDISNVDEGELRKVFSKLDFDDSGFITVDNLKELVGDDMTEAELKGMVNEFGEDKKEQIGLRDFVEMVKDVRRRRKSNFDATALSADGIRPAELNLVPRATSEEALAF